MYSTKESENKDGESIFCNGNFSEDEYGEIRIKCFNYPLWASPGLYHRRERRV